MTQEWKTVLVASHGYINMVTMTTSYNKYK